jgi:hypothetical protein
MWNEDKLVGAHILLMYLLLAIGIIHQTNPTIKTDNVLRDAQPKTV